MFRKENGVTLVALVITIIVLLILAGVTISMVLGEDGIISQASGASEAQNLASLKDHVSLALATMRTEDVAYAADVLSTSEKAAYETNKDDAAARVVAYLDKVDDDYEATKVSAGVVSAVIKNGQGEDVTYTFTITTEDSGNYKFISAASK